MSISKNEAIDIFVDMVEGGNCPDESLEKKHVHRGYTINRLAPNKFQISIERHPHIFGRSSLGEPSSAFATVKRTYELDTDLKKIDFIGEDVEDIFIDYEALAYQDVEMVLDSNMSEIEPDLVDFNTEDDVKIFAEKEFEGFDWLAGYDCDYDLPSDFEEELLATSKEVFVGKILEKWDDLKNPVNLLPR